MGAKNRIRSFGTVSGLTQSPSGIDVGLGPYNTMILTPGTNDWAIRDLLGSTSSTSFVTTSNLTLPALKYAGSVDFTALIYISTGDTSAYAYLKNETSGVTYDTQSTNITLAGGGSVKTWSSVPFAIGDVFKFYIKTGNAARSATLKDMRMKTFQASPLIS